MQQRSVPFAGGCGKSSAEGLYCIRWENSRQYESLNFMFNDYEDLSAVYEGAAVSFKMRTTNPAQVFDVRFVNRENDGRKPWRLSYTVHTKDYAADGKWHTVTIPLSSMKETGAWSQSDNKWYDGEGLFDLHNVYILQFSAEQCAVSGDIFLDDIKIAAR
jgi:endoglucanase